MSNIKYLVTVGGHISEPVTARDMITVCRAFGSSPVTVSVWKDHDIAHEFDLAAGEDVLDWAEAQLDDVNIDGGFDGSEDIVTFLRDILAAR